MSESGPSVAVVFLQPQCNMTCTFCVTEDDFEPMGYDDALELCDHLVELGVGSLVLGGGEPFAWPGDVLRLAGEARSRGLTVQVGTNGIALPDGFERLEAIDRWVLPIESSDPAVHDAMRLHREGHHQLILQRLRALQSVGRSVTLSTVLTSVNVEGLEDLARFLAQYHQVAGNVHAWHLYQFLPLGRGGRVNGDELAITTEAYHDACARVRALELPFRLFKRTDMYRSSTVEFFWSKGGRVVCGSEALHDESQRRTDGSATVL